MGIKLTLEIELPDDVELGTFIKHRKTWFPEPSTISISNTYLPTNPSEDNFYLFKFIKAEHHGIVLKPKT